MSTRRRTAVLVAALAATAATAVACTSDAAPTTAPTTTRAATTATTGAPAPCAEPGLPTTVAYRAIDGVPADSLSLDVHAVDGACGAPVVMWVHGGGYRVGDKGNQVAEKIRWAQDHGWILVSVNYRLTAAGDPTSAHFPDHFDDVAASVAWVRAEIGRYGGDPSRVALLGHSAGADIVANVTAEPTYLARFGAAPADLACAGPLDTAGFDKEALADDAAERDQWTEALGADHLADTSATRLVRAGAGHPPTIGVVRGTPARRAIERGYLEALEAVGVETVEIDARGLSHADVNRLIGAPGDTVMTPPLTDFLTACFAG